MITLKNRCQSIDKILRLEVFRSQKVHYTFLGIANDTKFVFYFMYAEFIWNDGTGRKSYVILSVHKKTLKMYYVGNKNIGMNTISLGNMVPRNSFSNKTFIDLWNKHCKYNEHKIK